MNITFLNQDVSDRSCMKSCYQNGMGATPIIQTVVHILSGSCTRVFDIINFTSANLNIIRCPRDMNTFRIGILGSIYDVADMQVFHCDKIHIFNLYQCIAPSLYFQSCAVNLDNFIFIGFNSDSLLARTRLRRSHMLIIHTFPQSFR